MTSKKTTPTKLASAAGRPGSYEHWEKLTLFEGARKLHPHYVAAFDQVLSIAQRGHTGKVVIVTGPSGVGKSTLAHSLLRKLEALAARELTDNPSLVPALLVQAIAPHSSEFSWKDFFTRTLEGLREPLLHKKLALPDQIDMWKEIQSLTRSEGRTADGLRRHTELALGKRRTRVLIIDEAHHMLLCRNPTSLRHQFEAIKSFSDTSGVTIVLVGTYDLLKIRDLSAQLIRRGQIVHFARYDFNAELEREAFQSVLHMLAGELPIPLAKSLLTEDVSFFYMKTAGCVGILRDLLRDSLADALEYGVHEISRTIIKRNAQPNKAIRTILHETAAGEVLLADIPVQDISILVRKSPAGILNALQPLLDAADATRKTGRSTATLPSLDIAASMLPVSSRRNGNRVGERRPQRDAVAPT